MAWHRYAWQRLRIVQHSKAKQMRKAHNCAWADLADLTGNGAPVLIEYLNDIASRHAAMEG